MKIYILDADVAKVAALKKAFAGEDVEIVNGYFDDFMKTHDVECVVSPANAYGLMDGGYDAAITRYFGEQLPKRVQRYIIENFFGEQPVGSSFIIDAGKNGQKLIHTPTMREPQRITDTTVVYQCMRTCLMTAINSGIKSIVIPVFGGRTGMVSAETAAKMMWLGYYRIMHPNTDISWSVVDEIDSLWLKELK